MTQFQYSDEGVHPPVLDDPLWQESQVLLWWDEGAELGGMQRVGQLPNQRKGNYWNGISCADGLRYRADTHDIPLLDGDRHPLGLSVGGQSMSTISEGVGVLEFDDGDTELHLRYEDFFPMSEVWPQGEGGRAEADMAAAHFETSGRVTGTVRMGERKFDVDGTFHRDHSWGHRNWEKLIGHRWVVGTAGPNFCFSSAVLLGEHDFVAGGYLIRDGERFQAAEVDIIVGVELDNVTSRTATVAWRLESGEVVIIDCEPRNGWMFGHGNYIEADQLGPFRVRGTDITGWCDVEISMNHRLHNHPVELAVGAGLDLGFSQARSRIGLLDSVQSK